MPARIEHKTVLARIVKYAQEIDLTFVPCGERAGPKCLILIFGVLFGSRRNEAGRSCFNHMMQ